MLNLLVVGVSRDRAVAKRELISLCSKTIIRLIEPPGSETLQPEIPALAEQTEPERGTSPEHGDRAPVAGKAAAPAPPGKGPNPDREGRGVPVLLPLGKGPKVCAEFFRGGKRGLSSRTPGKANPPRPPGLVLGS